MMICPPDPLHDDYHAEHLSTVRASVFRLTAEHAWDALARLFTELGEWLARHPRASVHDLGAFTWTQVVPIPVEDR